MSTVNQRRIRRIAARRYERASDLAWRDFLSEWKTDQAVETRRAADKQNDKAWWRFWI